LIFFEVIKVVRPAGDMSKNSSIMWLKSSLIVLFSTLPAVYGNILKARAGSKVLTPEVSASIDAIRRNASIPGYSIALVKLGKETEFGSWGNMTEDGKLISEDVRGPPSPLRSNISHIITPRH
jgi:hypothetical protein